MMTADHIAVSSYYGAPQTVAEQIASLPELKYEQTNIGTVKVDVLGPDAAMRTFTRLDGTYKGKPIPSPAFAIMLRQDSQWILPNHRGTGLAPLSRDQRMR